MKKAHGFTLIELLTAIIILALVLAITIPKVNSILNNSKRSLLKIDAEQMISNINKKKIMDRHFDITTIDITNIESVLGIGVDNYNQVLAQMYGDDIYIYIAGKNKWDGLYAYGTIDDIQITTEPVLVYYTKPTTYEYTNATNELIMNATNYLTVGCDDCYGTINLGFDFNFGGELYSKIYVGSNGKIVFSEKVTDYSYYRGNVDMNRGGPGFPVIAVYWTDMLIDKPHFSNSGIFYDIGTEDGKKYVLIEYRDIINYGNAGITADHPGSFEVKLYEDGIIKAYYADVEFGSYAYNNGADATFGVKVNDLNYAQYSYKESLIANNTAVMYDLKFGVKTPYDPVLATDPCFVFNSSTQTITGYNHSNPICPSSLIIPSTINGTTVKNIANNAFANKSLINVIISGGITTIGNGAFSNNQLRNVTIPNTVTSIGEDAFRQNFLTSIIIPSSVTSIGASAFNKNFLPDNQSFIYARNIDGSIDNTKIISYGGKRTDNIVIPSTVTTIADYAFWDNLITSIMIPNNITAIGMYAFDNNQLTNVTIPNNLAVLSEGVFETNLLTSVVIPDSVTTIDMYAFWDNQLTSIAIGSGVTIIGDWAFEINQLTNVEIPNNVVTIGEGAFCGNQLTGVTIGNGVTTINSYAFQNNKLINIDIPSSVTSIGKEAFNENLLPDNQAFIYARNADGSVNNTRVVSYGGAKRANVVIPNGVVTIGGSTFYRLNLSSVTISNSVTTIEEYAFYSNQITSVVLPSSVTTIGDWCFNGNGLTSVTLSNGIVSIGASSFRNNSLSAIAIPNSITTIGSYAFYNNYILQGSATIDKATGQVTIGSYAFRNNGADGLTTITPTYLR